MRKRKSVKGACAVSIIRGNDGPTSVFIAGKSVNQNIFARMKTAYQKKRHQRKRAAAIKSIKSEPHTLDEVIDYIIKQYGAVEPDQNSYQVKEGYRNVKGALVERHAPHLLGTPLRELRPKDFSDEKAVEEYLRLCEEYQKKAAEISEEIFPMDYHLYVIKIENVGEIQVEIEKNHRFFGAGFSGAPGKKKHLDKILKDIYSYYGVTKEDIASNTDRMKSLVAVLSS
ncbi:MAG: hypothetical protein HDR00_13545 [Lachnospiraceae bacterium]|nr:hypothetical protein [Lachnospiraceae bacterium]